jgi:hypothetical protein
MKTRSSKLRQSLSVLGGSAFQHHLTVILLVQTLALLTLPAQDVGFYRIVSTNGTCIISCDPPNALLPWTSSPPNACCAIERAGSLGGPWTSDFPHTVVASAGWEKVGLVPLGAGVPPDPVNCGAVLARITNSVQIGPNTCRIETYVWRDLMPSPPPPSGLLATVRLVEVNGFSIPDAVTITRIWVINGSAVWNVIAPPPNWSTPPYVLETTIRNGPYWEPRTLVDVVLEVANGNVRYLLRAANQEIKAVW